MFSVYLDDSAEREGSTIALGGYLASDEGWTEYERRIELIYRKHGVSYFHAKQFHNAKGEFKGWSGDDRRQFVEDVFLVASDLIECGLCVCISKSVGKVFKSVDRRNSGISPYGMAFGQIVSMVSEGHGLPVIPKQRPVSFFVEDGSRNNEEFRKNFVRLSKANAYGGLLSSFSIAGKKSCKAIQLADFFAFYGRRYVKGLPKEAHEGAGDIPDALRIASARIPHCIERISGGVSSVIGKPNLLSVGLSRRVWLAPVQPNG